MHRISYYSRTTQEQTKHVHIHTFNHVHSTHTSNHLILHQTQHIESNK